MNWSSGNIWTGWQKNRQKKQVENTQKSAADFTRRSNRGALSRGFGLLFLLLVTILQSGCVGLVRPNFSQSLTELRPGAYTLDPEHAYVTFRVGHLGLSKVVGRFNVVAGELDFDPANIEQMALTGIIEANSVDMNNAELDERLRGSNWFNADTFPQISFVTSSVVRNEDDVLLITGNLSLRGVEKELVLEAKFNGGADNILTGKYTLGFSATTQFKRSDFGMDAFAALVADDIDVELHGEFQRN